jgi:integrase
VALIAYRGLRRAEAVGLAAVDVDLDAGTVTVRETIVDAADDEYEDPKSRSSQRTIGLDKATTAVLRAWQQRQEQERHSWGAEWVYTGRLFTKENGEALDPDSVSQRFDRLIERTGRADAQCSAATRSGDRCRRIAADGAACPKHGGAKSADVPPSPAGLPPIRLHDLRHTAASLTYLATRDLKLVSELLGHSSIQITGDIIYTTVFAEVDRAAAEAVAALVPRKRTMSAIEGSSATSAAPCPRAHQRTKRATERAALKANPQVTHLASLLGDGRANSCGD